MVLLWNILRRKGCQPCLESKGARVLSRTAAIYYLRIFPSAHALETPRSFLVLPAKSLHGSREPFLFTARRFRSVGTHQGIAVLSALQNLVSRLEEWEHNLGAPLTTQADSEAPDPSSTTIPIQTNEINSKSLSMEEYARIFVTGYPRLAPLQLGWIATTAFQNDLILQEDYKCPRTAVLLYLARECGLPQSAQLLPLLQDCQADPTLLERLRKAWTPKFEDVFQCLLEQNSGQTVPLLVQLRGDVLRLMSLLPKTTGQDSTQRLLSRLQQLEGHLRRLLSAWFSPGMLDIRRITFNTTSAGIIEKIAIMEAVHPMKSLDDLRRRLGPKRRVFALFHPLLPNEPLVILHVHLETKPNHIPSIMPHVLRTDDSTDDMPLQPLVATFYSISNTQAGLTRGLGLGEFLIKQAVQQLQQEFPSALESFVTLSPMPGFGNWLAGIVGSTTSQKLSDQQWAQGLADEGVIGQHSIPSMISARPKLQELLACTKGNGDKMNECDIQQRLEDARDSLMVLAAHYIVRAKNQRSGKPLDPVTGFHVHNGAEVYRINFAADLSRKGLMRSLGVMVNYQYQLGQIEANKARFESSHYKDMPMSIRVQDLLTN